MWHRGGKICDRDELRGIGGCPRYRGRVRCRGRRHLQGSVVFGRVLLVMGDNVDVGEIYAPSPLGIIGFWAV